MGNSIIARPPVLSGSIESGRFKIPSSNSDNEYVIKRIASGPNAGCWSCGCPRWISHKQIDFEGRTTCKHLIAMALPGPIQNQGTGHPGGHFPTSADYSHYDASQGFGSAADWVREAEAHGAGRGAFKGALGEAPSADLQLLGLAAPPATIDGLKSAMRKMAFATHPDSGGSEAAFTDMMKAYERLLPSY